MSTHANRRQFLHEQVIDDVFYLTFLQLTFFTVFAAGSQWTDALETGLFIEMWLARGIVRTWIAFACVLK